jgi:adenylate cyclase
MTLRRSKKKRVSISHAFENEFALEVLRSDQLRVTILTGVICAALFVVAALMITDVEQFRRAFHGRLSGFIISFGFVAGSAFACLLIERVIITRMIRRQRSIPVVVQYVSALVETSIPTAGMIVASTSLGSYTLFTPAAFVYPIFISLSALRLNLRLCMFTGFVAGVEYAVLGLYFANSNSHIEPILSGVPHHLLKGFLLFATGVVMGLVTRQVKKRTLKAFEMIDERNRISRTFGEYVSPVVMEKLMALKPDLRSERRNVCVMFLDIRNFTTFSEKRAPEEVVTYLESLFEFMIEIVNRHHGVINKFLGDGFMAVFGAPLSDGSDCLHGVTAAQEILSRVREEVDRGNVLPTKQSRAASALRNVASTP